MPRSKRLKMSLLRLYPPYLGAGVCPDYIAPDFSCFDVKMVMRFWNRNYVGTHFGGSLYSMCDPFFMLILLECLGRDYLVWDKTASIRFKRPGRGTVWARFHVPRDEVERVRGLADREPTVEPVYSTRILDSDGELVAEVEKRLWVSKKRRKSEAAQEQ
ncbi:MAG: DUF4442 domain-containing protein [Thermoanaerobaculia bacterium]|nr:DUF4442 domain-containing protein [Thermoanaerobaculia bacterium]